MNKSVDMSLAKVARLYAFDSVDAPMTALFRQLMRGAHHLVVEQSVSIIPGLHVPVVWLAEPDGNGGERLRHVGSLVDYCAAHSARSSTWMANTAIGLGLFYDYLIQNHELIKTKVAEAESDISINIHNFVLTIFQNHLARGTFTVDREGNLKDETGLFWPKRSPDRVLAMMRGLDGYVRWLHGCGYGDRLGSMRPALNREVPMTGAEAIRFAYIAQFRKQLSFLTHVAEQRQQRQPISRDIVGSTRTDPTISDVVQFPRKYLAKLIFEGFVINSDAEDTVEREDHTAKLVTMLLAWYGLRYSEAVQMWVSDFQLMADGELAVFLQNPFLAKVQDVPGGPITRAEYLRIHCGMEPRQWARGGQKAGWKGIMTNTEHWAVAYPLPFDGIKERFKEAIQFYLGEVRPRLMRERLKRGLPDHPFICVSAGSSNRGESEEDQSQVGAPYTLVH